jgi:hypothetical protein
VLFRLACFAHRYTCFSFTLPIHVQYYEGTQTESSVATLGSCCFRNWMFLSPHVRKGRCVLQRGFISITGRLPSCAVYTPSSSLAFRPLLFIYFETPRTLYITHKIRFYLFIIIYVRGIFEFYTCIQTEMCAKMLLFWNVCFHVKCRLFLSDFSQVWTGIRLPDMLTFHENLFSDSSLVSWGQIWRKIRGAFCLFSLLLLQKHCNPLPWRLIMNNICLRSYIRTCTFNKHRL